MKRTLIIDSLYDCFILTDKGTETEHSFAATDFVSPSFKYPSELEGKLARLFYGKGIKTSTVTFEFTEAGQKTFEKILECNRINY